MTHPQRILFVFCLSSLVAVRLVAVTVAAAVTAEVADADDSEVRREIDKLVKQLDSDRFADRKAAVDRLRHLAARPALGTVLAREFERTLLQAEISFEVRKHLQQLLRDLPPAEPEPGGKISADEIERLVTQLEDDSFAKRLGAAKRIDWVVNDPQMALSVYSSLKRRLHARELPADAPTWLEPVLDRARGVWLATDLHDKDFPPVDDKQVDRWIHDLSRPILETDSGVLRRGRRVAERELRDLLASEKCVPQVKRLLESRLAAGDVAPEDLSRVAGILYAQTNQLARLIEDVMALARLESHEFTLRPHTVELEGLVLATVETFLNKASSASIRLSAHDVEPVSVTIDPDRLIQVLGNLIENALRYTPEGGFISVGCRATDDGCATITVENSGPGIAAHDLPHVFERLYVADRYRAVRPAGSGLGLAIVSEIVEAMGGSIDCASPPEGGTVFSVTIG